VIRVNKNPPQIPKKIPDEKLIAKIHVNRDWRGMNKN
jgi:hypothetical protein